MKTLLIFIVLSFTLTSFGNDKCPKFSKRQYKCNVVEDGDIREEKAQITVSKKAGKSIFNFTSQDFLNQIVLDGQIRKTTTGFNYRAFCKNNRIRVDLKDLNITMIIRGTKRKAVVKAFLYGENISTATCRR